LWVNESGLWQWMLREHPDSVAAKDRLLSIYMARDDRPRARALADEVVTRHVACVTCLLNAAYLAIGDGDAARAEQALDQVKDSNKLAYSARLLRGFVLANGQLLELRSDRAGAEEAYRDAMTLGEFDPQPPMALAMLLARQGRNAEARNMADIALALFAPDERDTQRRAFEQVVAASAATGAH
jgi:Flp pilus assembly protein TadD